MSKDLEIIKQKISNFEATEKWAPRLAVALVVVLIEELKKGK
jgi:hypothetical protein